MKTKLLACAIILIKKYNLDVEQIVADTFNMQKQTHKTDDRAVFLIIRQPTLVKEQRRSIV